MSISALTSEASRLLAEFQSKEAAINAALAALPAIGGLKAYYVDSIAGDDGNAGTSAAPFESLNKALAMISEKTNYTFLIYFASDGEYAFDRTCTIDMCHVEFHGYDPRAIGSGKPTVNFQFYSFSESGVEVVRPYGFLGDDNSVFVLDCNLVLPAVPAEFSALPSAIHHGLTQNGWRREIVIQNSSVTIDDYQWFDQRTYSFKFVNVDFNRSAGSQKLIVNLGAYLNDLMLNNCTFPSGEDLHDWFGFAGFDSVTGRPLGVVSNLEISAPA